MWRIKNWQCTLLVAILVLGLCFSTLAAETAPNFNDIQGHWAAKTINKWVAKGLTKGYPDGTFQPDKSITRAEFMTWVNSVFGYTKTVPLSFSDVSEKDWFAKEVARAQAVGYIKGYPDGTVKPNNFLSRQEVAVVLANILALKAPAPDVEDKFLDGADIPSWSKAAINAIVDSGCMKGYPDGTFKPTQPITRAEALSVLDSAADIADDVAVDVVYDKAGIYGSEDVTVVPGNVTISTRGVTLKNMVISGNLNLAQGIGSGDVTLKNVQVKGTTKVSGGGEDSIIIIDSDLGLVIVDVPDNHRVRLVAQGNTTIGTVDARTEVILEEKELTGTGFGDVILQVPAGAKIKLVGDFREVNVETPQVHLDVQGGTVQRLTLSPAAKGSEINLASDATIDIFTTHSAASVTGAGTIITANINANGVNLARKPSEVNVAEGVEATIAGETVEGTKVFAPPATGGGTGGGGTKVRVSAISVDPESATLFVGQMLELTAEVTVRPDTETNKKVTWKSDKNYVATVDNEGLVTAVGAGTAIITATAVKDSGKKANCVVSVKEQVVYQAKGNVTEIEPYTVIYEEPEGRFLLLESITEFTFKDSSKHILARYDRDEWIFRELVIYEADGDVTDIDPDTAIYEEPEGRFLLSESVTEFTFKDGDVKMKAIFAEEKWIIARLILSNYRVDWLADPDIGYYEINGEIEALDQYGNTYELDTVKDCRFVVWQGSNWIFKQAEVTFSNGMASFKLTGAAVPRITNVSVYIDDVQYYRLGNTGAYDAIIASLPEDNNYGLYTAASWGAFEEAIAECNLELTAEVGQWALDAEVIKIQEALDLLEKVEGVDADTYYAIVASIPENNDKGLYTVASWGAFEAAIAECDLELIPEVGQAALDTEVTKIQEALDLLVKVEEITSATVFVTAPVLGHAPEDEEIVEPATNDPSFTVTSVAWLGDFTSEDKFRAENVYSATIELTAKAGKMFALDSLDSFEATVGDATISDVEISSTGEGNKVTFKATFAATGDLEVSGIAVKTQPELKYFENAEHIEKTAVQNTLNLSKLVATLIYNDGTTKDVPYSGFEDHGIGTSLEDGQVLTVDEHDGQTVGLTCNGYTTNTSKLDVTIGVEEIIVTSAGGKTTIGKGERFQMYATITNYNATNKEVRWECNPFNTYTYIQDTGLLVRSSSDGGPSSVTVRATSKDGSDTFGEMVIQCP